MSQRKPSNALSLYSFLSSRLNQGRGFGSFVKGTAVLGILVGATALWITLSVVRGFSTVISEKTIEFYVDPGTESTGGVCLSSGLGRMERNPTGAPGC